MEWLYFIYLSIKLLKKESDASLEQREFCNFSILKVVFDLHAFLSLSFAACTLATYVTLPMFSSILGQVSSMNLDFVDRNLGKERGRYRDNKAFKNGLFSSFWSVLTNYCNWSTRVSFIIIYYHQLFSCIF